MHYAKFLLALPLAAAVPVNVDTMETEIEWKTEVVEVTVTVCPATGQTGAPEVPGAALVELAEEDVVIEPPPVPTTTIESKAVIPEPVIPIKTEIVHPPPPPVPVVPRPPPPPQVPSGDKPGNGNGPGNGNNGPGNGGSGGSGGCPSDGNHLSPGVDGNPDKSMLDSVNYIRRLYNPNAKCLKWSDSLRLATLACVDGKTESLLRANSGIVSDNGGYGNGYYKSKLATTEFERSMFVLLCQSTSDPQLQGTCPGEVGEIGCSSGACNGHRDMLVDAAGEYSYFGGAFSPLTGWASASFSKTNGIFE